MSIADEVYGEGRASRHEPILPYLISRINTYRSTAISEPRRFFVLAIGIFACICASTGYAFNLFSGQLQEKYHLSQSDLSTITTGSSVLNFFVFPLANMYDVYGPELLFLTAVLAFPTGAILFGLSFANVIQGSVVRFTLYLTMMSIGSSMFDIAGLMTLLSIFPSSRGAVIAVMKTFVGLGSSILACVSLGFFENNISGFFYFMSLQIAFVGLAAIVFIELPPYHLTKWAMRNLSEEEKNARLATKTAYFEQIPPMRRFGIGFAIVMFLIVFLPAQSAATSLYTISDGVKRCFALCALFAAFLSFTMCLRIPWLDAGNEEARERLTPLTDPQLDVQDGQQVSREALQRMSSRIFSQLESTRGSMVQEAVFHVPLVEGGTNLPPQYPNSFRQSLRTKELWALTFTIFCLSGTQMVIIANARFIYAAVVRRPARPEETVLLTVINGTGSALGRIAISCVEMLTQKGDVEKRMSITKMLFIPTTAVLIAAILLIFVPSHLAILPFVVTALANGFTAATVVLVVRGLYANDVANHYNFTSVGVILSSFFLNKCLYGNWYTRTAKKQGSTLCYGRECILLPFALMAVLTACSLFINYWLDQRYVSFCTATFAERMPSRPQEPNTAEGEEEQLLTAAPQ